jgi:EF-P beta-lysylation protein EpmB
MARCTLNNTSDTATLPAADWTAELAASVREPAELCRLLGLETSVPSAAASDSWPMLVPRPYLARIRRGDPADPLLRQVLPQAAELDATAGYTTDPLDERAAQCAAGVLRKYRGRLLMVATPVCGVHCRFCFRRHFLLPDNPPCNTHWTAALRAIAADRTIHEVILSGGDPLTLPDHELAELARRLAEIRHLRRLRVHTRMPVVIPQRVTDELLDWLMGMRLAPIVVVHINHAAEIDPAVAAALGRLIDAGVPLMAQSVLLRGVNDTLDALAELYERLVDLRVLPYYLHQLDAVAGAAHFAVPPETGATLVAALREQLPGYAVPRYVREVPGAKHKAVLA